jgi:hypothetical protein
MIRFMNALSVVCGAMFLNADDGANAAGGASPTTPTPTPKKEKVPADVFVKACNELNSVKEVAAKLGLTENNVHQRRHQLAKLGVVLKAYKGRRGGNKLDIEALKALGQSTLPEGSTAFVATTRTVAEVPEAPQAPEAPQDGQTEQTAEQGELQTA